MGLVGDGWDTDDSAARVGEHDRTGCELTAGEQILRDQRDEEFNRRLLGLLDDENKLLRAELARLVAACEPLASGYTLERGFAIVDATVDARRTLEGPRS